MKIKICTKCKEEKFLEDFKKDKNSPSGYGSWCKKCHNKDSVNWNHRNSHARWRDAIKQKYGIDEKDYDKLFEQQNGVCAICGEPERVLYKGTPRKLAVDHSHVNGKVRGLLCTKCNVRLGFLEDLEFITKARIYLDEHNFIQKSESN